MEILKSILLCSVFFIVGYSLKLTPNETTPCPASITKKNIENSNLILSQCEDKYLEITNKFNGLSRLNHCTPNKLSAQRNYDNKQGEAYQEREEGNQNSKDQLAMLSDYYIENEINKHKKFLKSINASHDNIHQALRENYQKDMIDSTWSSKKKALLDEYIAINDLLNSLPNVESDCRSKQCKISILSDDPIALSRLAENLGGLVNNNEFITYTYAIDEENHTTTIYLDRKSKKLIYDR